MFSIYNIFDQSIKKTETTIKGRVTAYRSVNSNMYLYPAMECIVKSIRHNHGMAVDPSDGSFVKVRAVIETNDGQIGAWIGGVDHFSICKLNVIKGLPVSTIRLLDDAENTGSIERSIRRYNETHDHVILSWIAV